MGSLFATDIASPKGQHSVISAIRRRMRHDDGSVAVEAAFVIPLLLLIIFGIIEFSMVLRNNAALSGATRAGARVASAEPRMATFTQDAADAALQTGVAMPVGNIEEIWIYRAGTNGKPLGQSSFTSCGANCARFTINGGAAQFAGGSYPATNVNACPGQMHNVGVYIKAKHTFVSGLFGSTMALTDHASTKFEPIPTTRQDRDNTCR